MKSYVQCDCGNGDCSFFKVSPDEPCYGKVELVNSFWTEVDDVEYENFVHLCEGHRPTDDVPPKPYQPDVS